MLMSGLPFKNSHPLGTQHSSSWYQVQIMYYPPNQSSIELGLIVSLIDIV